MKKMKLLVAVLAIMMSFAFAACTSQTSETPSGHVHEWGEWTETKAPTCVEEGEETRVCKLDESHIETRSVSIDPDAHEWGEWAETKAPTCVEEGEETRVCKLDESHKETRSVSIDPDAHEWGEWVETKAPSYTEEGEETRTCKNDSKHVETRPVDKLQHAPITEMTLTSSASYSLIRGIADEAQGVTADATAQISLTVTYLGGEEAAATSADVTFASDDPTVASVNEDGLITFNAVGTATITIKSKYEKQGGGYMEETIAVTVNDLPKNSTGLEVISFEHGIDEQGQPYLDFEIENVSTGIIEVRTVDVYYVDSTGKILKTHSLYVGTISGGFQRLEAGEKIKGGVSGGSALPEGTAEIVIFKISV